MAADGRTWHAVGSAPAYSPLRPSLARITLRSRDIERRLPKAPRPVAATTVASWSLRLRTSRGYTEVSATIPARPPYSKLNLGSIFSSRWGPPRPAEEAILRWFDRNAS